MVNLTSGFSHDAPYMSLDEATLAFRILVTGIMVTGPMRSTNQQGVTGLKTWTCGQAASSASPYHGRRLLVRGMH